MYGVFVFWRGFFKGPKQLEEPVKGAVKTWLATIPGKGFFVILRLYGPTKAFYDQAWKPDDVEKYSPTSGT